MFSLYLSSHRQATVKPSQGFIWSPVCLLSKGRQERNGMNDIRGMT